MTAVQRRRRTLARVAFWALLALWLAPHVARQDGAWALTLATALTVVASQTRRVLR